jgi:carboxypeptidase T
VVRAPSRSLTGVYAGATVYEQRWRELVAHTGGREVVAGLSGEGRPIWRFDLGARDPAAPAVLLTALIHGAELIGSVALLDAVARLATSHAPVLDRARLVVMPIVNPDALAANMDRLQRGRAAGRRCNARGVDLNRNFPPVARARRAFHPMAGSGLRASPYYRGPHPLSEPESRAVSATATEVRPRLALGFHSFGNLLLYPWAHSRAPNPRLARYARLAQVFLRKLPHVAYRLRQAADWYPTVGDLDDWLDVTFGTVAFTVEVSGLDRRLLHPRALNPFWWMNPLDVDGVVANVSPGVVDLIAGGLTFSRP